MAEPESPSTGLLASLRSLCDSGLALLQTRAELLGVELQEQKLRLVRVLVLAAVAVFLANMAAVVVTATIVFLASESVRVPLLLVFSAFYVVATTVAFLWLRKELRGGAPPLADTVSELKKDREWLNSRN